MNLRRNQKQMKNKKKQATKYLNELIKITKKGFQERMQFFPKDTSRLYIYEVLGSLLSRQATVFIEMAKNPGVWNGHLAPVILRTMIDTHITFTWITQMPDERAKEYILYGLGQEKLAIEHLKNDSDENDEYAQLQIEAREAWLNSQQYGFLTEVNIGNWAGKNTRSIAEEAGLLRLYNYSYQAFSSCTHSMWHHISRYNVRQCMNPLHRYHRVPAIIEVPLDVDYLYRAAKYLQLSFEVFDEKYDHESNTIKPRDYFEQQNS